MSEILDRILKAYNRNDGKENPSEMWDYCVRRSKEVDLTVENLENMGNNTLVTGFFGITRTPDDQVALNLLAESVGVRGIQNPEGAVNPIPVCNRETIYNSDLLMQIMNKIGVIIPMPGFIGNKHDAIHTEFGLITARHCYYLALLKRIIDYFPSRQTRILEIGAGLGMLGYFLDTVGYKDYTIIDIARTNAIQAYFLSRNLPDREIILSGERKDFFDNSFSEAIKILHVSDFKHLPFDHYTVMVNMDGMTEWTRADAEMYVNSDCAQNFLSINHEMNDFRVIEVCEQYRKLLYRYPFHPRPGYVEEMYELKI